MLKLICAVSAIALTAAVAAAAQAQTNTPAAGQQQTAGPNPDEIICQKLEVTGSRLGVKRVCKTRAEWADARLQDRQELERVQVQRGMKSE